MVLHACMFLVTWYTAVQSRLVTVAGQPLGGDPVPSCSLGSQSRAAGRGGQTLPQAFAHQSSVLPVSAGCEAFGG